MEPARESDVAHVSPLRWLLLATFAGQAALAARPAYVPALANLAEMLGDDQATNDIVAYINTLK